MVLTSFIRSVVVGGTMTGMVGWAVPILLAATGTELGTVVDPKFVAEPPLPVLLGAVFGGCCFFFSASL